MIGVQNDKKGIYRTPFEGKKKGELKGGVRRALRGKRRVEIKKRKKKQDAPEERY